MTRCRWSERSPDGYRPNGELMRFTPSSYGVEGKEDEGDNNYL